MRLGDFFEFSLNFRIGDKPQKKGKSNVLPLLIFGLLFFIMGSIGMYVFLWVPLKFVSQSHKWEKTDAVVLSNRLEESISESTRLKTMYSIHIVYEYSYKDNKYQGDLYDFFRSGNKKVSAGRNEMRKIVAAHPTGASIICLVNPDNPKQSVISRDIYWPSLLIGIVPLLLFIVSIGFFIAIFKKVFLQKSNNNKSYKTPASNNSAQKKSVSTKEASTPQSVVKMKIDGTTVKSENQILQALADVENEDEELAILEQNEHEFMQTSNGELEFRDQTGHYRAPEAPIEAEKIREAFLSYYRGDEKYRSAFRWERLV